MDLAIAFLEWHEEHRLSVRAQSVAANPQLIESQRSILSAIIELKQRGNGIRYRYEDGRMHLVAQFIQGIGLSYIAILDGLYAQAANLQKQQVESIAALEQYRDGTRQDGKTPHIGSIPHRGFGKLYGELNDIAHPSKEHLLEALCHYEEDGKQGPTTKPQFKQDVCQYLLSNHCLQLLHFWRVMSHVYRDGLGVEFPEQDDQDLSGAIKHLIDRGSLGYDG